MSKQESLARHSVIIKSLKTKPCSFEELLDKLRQEGDLNDMDFDISKRTFQRDLKEISALYKIYIKFDRANKKYQIEENLQDDYSERMFEALDIFQILNLNQSIAQFIQFDTRKPMGTEHLNGFLHAIQNKIQVQFRYQKFYKEESEMRTVEPYLLKEYRKRWYVFAYDLDKKEFRTFGLDRIFALKFSSIKFQYPQDIRPKEYFKSSFGIIGPSEGKIEEIKLLFTRNQGNYVRTMPLHPSQQIFKDENGEMLVSVKLIPTYDFISEILANGEFVKVIEPKKLAKEIKDKITKMLSIYP